MEKGGRKGKQKEDDEKITRRKKRGPLQDLNGHLICNTHYKNTSSHSSSAAASSIEVPRGRGCSRLFPSSNSCSSSSSTRTPIEDRPKGFSKLAINGQMNSSRMVLKSNENEASKKPLLQTSKRIQPQGVKNAKRPIGESGHHRSKLSSAVINPGHRVKKDPQKLQVNRGKANSNSSAEKCTPVGKVAPLCNLDFKNSDGHKHARKHVNNTKASSKGNNSGSDVKTPPAEASLSPEIQRQSHSKMMLLNSAATPAPVCYGTSHLLSGITDKRRCRRRGSLRGGSERVNLFNGEMKRDSLVPLLAEASVRWQLSPCREDLTNTSGQCSGNDLNTPDLLSSPSLLCGNTYDLLSTGSCYSGSSSVGNRVENKNIVDSIREATEFKGLLGPLNAADEYLLASSPSDLTGDNSVGSLGSGNMIQTPTSDTSLDVYVEGLKSKVHCKNIISPDLDPKAEILRRIDLFPGSESSGLTEYPKNVDSVSSWASNSVLEAVGLSQMKISWQDGLLSKNEEADELDCCCLLDEEINGRKSTPKDGKPLENDEIGLGREMDMSPIISEYEPCISTKGEEKLLPHVADACAESICTDGGGLAASGDSDWMHCYDR